jgi:hypothetical protein
MIWTFESVYSADFLVPISNLLTFPVPPLFWNIARDVLYRLKICIIVG